MSFADPKLKAARLMHRIRIWEAVSSFLCNVITLDCVLVKCRLRPNYDSIFSRSNVQKGQDFLLTQYEFSYIVD